MHPLAIAAHSTIQINCWLRVQSQHCLIALRNCVHQQADGVISTFANKYVRNVTQVLAALAGAVHELVPPESLAPVLRQLVDQFVHDRCVDCQGLQGGRVRWQHQGREGRGCCTVLCYACDR